MGDLGSIPGLGRSPGDGKGYPCQYSGLENSMGCIVHVVAKSQTRLSNFHFHMAAKIRKLYLKMNEISHWIPSIMPITAVWRDGLQLCLSFVELGDPWQLFHFSNRTAVVLQLGKKLGWLGLHFNLGPSTFLASSYPWLEPVTISPRSSALVLLWQVLIAKKKKMERVEWEKMRLLYF